MTNYSTLYPDQVTLISRKWFKTSGMQTQTVPAGAAYARAICMACGGQGDNVGGGSALAISKFQVTPGEVLNLQVGNTSTASTQGDSFVKRASGETLVYADRGRGNGTQGLSSNCIGDIRRSGTAGYVGSFSDPSVGGASGNDMADYGTLGVGGRGAQVTVTGADDIKPADHGGGGQSRIIYQESGDFYYSAIPSGPGCVVFEFFNQDPG